MTTDKKRNKPKKTVSEGNEYDPRFPASDPSKVKVIKKNFVKRDFGDETKEEVKEEVKEPVIIAEPVD